MQTPARKHRRIKRILAVAAVDLVVLAVIFAALEIYYRRTVTYLTPAERHSIFGGGSITAPQLLVEDTPLGRRVVPNANVIIKGHIISGQDVLIRTNSLGFRGPDVAPGKMPGEVRILVLGDSITWASYLPEEQTFVARIGHYLNTWDPGRKHTVINAGVEDIGTREEVDILEDRGLAVHPDVVIVAFYLNDSRPSWGFAQEADSYGYVLRHSIFLQTIYQKLVFRKWIKETGVDRFAWVMARDDPRWKTDHGRFMELVGLARYDWGAAWQDDSWTMIQPALERLKADAEANGFKVLLVAFPTAFQVYASFQEDKPQRVLSQKASGQGFYYLDLMPMLRARKNEILYYDQCHPRAPANDHIGKAIAEFLRDNVITPGPAPAPDAPPLDAGGSVR